MSRSSADALEFAGAGGGSGAPNGGTTERAPKLLGAGHYTSWRAQMEVFLAQRGAGDALSKQRTQEDWAALVAVATQMADEEEMLALETLGLTPTPTPTPKKTGQPNSATSSGPGGTTDRQKEARRVVANIVQRSQRVFGHLYGALPKELHPQVAHLPQGFAYGLWQWIEEKYRSKEIDNVSVLFREWSLLEQGEEESFDAYRARVNHLSELLSNADEKPSARMYAYTLLERLRPHYKPVVLALQNSSTMKKTKKIQETKTERVELDVDWVEVSRQVNAHERSEQRLGVSDEAGQHQMGMSAWRTYSAVQQRGRRDLPPWNSRGEPRCYNCNQYGHMKHDCKKPMKMMKTDREDDDDELTGTAHSAMMRYEDEDEYMM